MANYHEWGSNFDFNALDDAGNYLHVNCRRWARMGIWVKEKWGTLRVSTTCACFTEIDFIHRLFYPGYAHYMFPRWFRQYVDWPFGKLMRILGVVWLLQKWQRTVLKYFWNRAAKKWPHVAEEILDDYEWILDEKPPNYKGVY